jgi:hypothetical protein
VNHRALAHHTTSCDSSLSGKNQKWLCAKHGTHDKPADVHIVALSQGDHSNGSYCGQPSHRHYDNSTENQEAVKQKDRRYAERFINAE